MKKISSDNIDKYIFDPDNFDRSAVEEVLLSESLFGTPRLIVFKNLKKELEELKPLIKQSKHEVLIVDGKDKAPKAGKEFNPFALADALADRDRKRLWLLWTERLRGGGAAEELFWSLAWQAKTMLLVGVSGPQEKLDLKPFVESKARRALKNWPLAELKKLYSDLVEAYHQTYHDSDDFSFRLEKIILNV